jgi:ubiquinone/menaquinone biosynthesis C-methylase UbiE
MTDDRSQHQSENSYVNDAESGAEMARLLDQERLLTEGMGGLFSERSDLSNIFDMLDIGCGPGGWVHDVAHTYPEIEVTGIDISNSMIAYARAHAEVRGFTNTHFRVMNALKQLDFPDASFDLVNARAALGFVPTQMWPQVIAEYKRVLRPGGIVRLTEGEWGFTNKSALETLLALSNNALHKAGYGASPTGRHEGLTPMLRYWLRQAGFQEVQQQAHVIDYSFGTKAYAGAYEDYKLMLRLAQPFWLKMGIATQDELETFYERVMAEMAEEDFCAVWYLLTTWGEKPL